MGQTVGVFGLAPATKGRLLVATPPLNDPNFDRAVIYVLEHHDDGAVGVVINRPSSEALDETLDRWIDLQTVPSSIFDGGPVEDSALIALALTKQGTGEDENGVVGGGLRLQGWVEPDHAADRGKPGRP